MRIAFYIPVLNVGGAEKVIINLMKQLSIDEKNIYYLITDSSNSTWINEIDNKINILNVDSKKNFLTRFYNIYKVIKKNKIDIVVSHLTHSNIHCLLLKNLFSFKLVIVEHNITSTYINDIPKLKYFLRILIKSLFRKADKIVCVSETTKKDLVEYFNIPSNKCQVIYNPFDFKKIEELSVHKIPLDFVKKINKRKYLVAVSRLEIQKNHLFLIDSLKSYLLSENVVLILIGGGSQQNVIESEIVKLNLTDHVFLTGNISNPYPYILKADLLIHPARFEGFGLVLIEAIFLGTKVISMNFETAYEVLDNGRLGTLVSDKETLLAAINSKFDNFDKDLNHHSSKEIYNDYNLEFIASQYYEVLKMV